MTIGRSIIRISFTMTLCALAILLLGICLNYAEFPSHFATTGTPMERMRRRSLLPEDRPIPDNHPEHEKENQAKKEHKKEDHDSKEEKKEKEEKKHQQEKESVEEESKETSTATEETEKSKTGSSSSSSSSSKDSGSVSDEHTHYHSTSSLHNSIALSVCCLPNSRLITDHAQDLIDLFFTTSIAPLGAAIRETSQDSEYRLTKKDAINIKNTITSHDISLRITDNVIPEVGVENPENMIFEFKNHDDEFIDKVIKQIWRSSHRLENTMATTIDSYRNHSVGERMTSISVLWIYPHWIPPVVSASPGHVHHVLDHLEELNMEQYSEIKGNTTITTTTLVSREDVEKHEAHLARRKKKENMLRQDLQSLRGLISHANKALPPLHNMAGFLDHHQSKMRENVAALQSDLALLENQQQTLSKKIEYTQVLIREDELHRDDLYRVIQHLRAEESTLWESRVHSIDRLREFEQEWDQMVHSTLLYQSYLLHKYRVLRDRQYKGSELYFMADLDGGDSHNEKEVGWSCEYDSNIVFCNERVIECRATGELLKTSDVDIEILMQLFSKMEGQNIDDLEMVLIVDDKESHHCDEGKLEDSDESSDEVEMEEPCEWPRCDVKTSLESIQTMCLYVKCEDTVAFGLNTRIHVSRHVEPVPVPTAEITAAPIMAPTEQEDASPFTVMHWFTIITTVGFTFGAILMSLFYLQTE